MCGSCMGIEKVVISIPVPVDVLKNNLSSVFGAKFETVSARELNIGSMPVEKSVRKTFRTEKDTRYQQHK